MVVVDPDVIVDRFGGIANASKRPAGGCPLDAVQKIEETPDGDAVAGTPDDCSFQNVQSSEWCRRYLPDNGPNTCAVAPSTGCAETGL